MSDPTYPSDAELRELARLEEEALRRAAEQREATK